MGLRSGGFFSVFSCLFTIFSCLFTISKKNPPLLKHILALPMVGQICLFYELQPFDIATFDLGHPVKFKKNVVALLFRRFNQWSLSFILSEKLCTSHWKIMPRLFHFLQKILENCKCTTSKCLIHSSLGLQAIYSAIIHGPIPKLSLVPYIPSNGTKRTRSFFGKSFPIIALWENQIDSQIKRHFFLTKKGVKVTFQTIVSDCNIVTNNEPVSKIHFLTFCLSWMNCSYYLFLFFFIQCVPMTQMPSPEDH